MNRIDTIKKIGRIGAYMMLSLSALILIFWRAVENFLPSDSGPEILIGLVVAGFTAIAIDIYSQISKINMSDVAQVSHQSIKDSISKAVDKKNRIDTLRVFASTSEIILPIIRESGIFAKKCKLMLQKLEENSGDKKAKSMNIKCDGFIESWKGMTSHEQRILGELEVKRFDFLPNHYFVIFGDSHLVYGLYHPTNVDGHSVDFLEPVLVDSSTTSGQRLIKKYQSLFDTIYAQGLD